MTLLSFILGFLVFAPIAEDVVIKSMLSKDQTRVLVDITLPEDAPVAFSLADSTGDMKHHWQEQELHQGRHQLALPVPDIAQGKYLLLIMVGAESYEQLVFLSRN